MGQTQRDPETAWLRIKETRHLGKRSRGVAQTFGFVGGNGPVAQKIDAERLDLELGEKRLK